MTDFHDNGLPFALCKCCLRVPFTKKIFMFMFVSPQLTLPHIVHPESYLILGILSQIAAIHPYWKCYLVSILPQLAFIFPWNIDNIKFLTAISDREAELLQPQFTLRELISHHLASHRELDSAIWQCLSSILAWHWGPSPQCSYLGLSPINNVALGPTLFSTFLDPWGFCSCLQR